MRRRSIRGWAATLLVIESVLLAAAIVAGAVALDRLTGARAGLIDEIDPQMVQANTLTTALLNQETGVRGYIISANPTFAQPYIDGRRQQDTAVATLRNLGTGPGTDIGRSVDDVVGRATAWQQAVAEPVIRDVRAIPPELVSQSKPLFDRVRAALDALNSEIGLARAEAKADLSSAATFLAVMLAAVSVLLALLLVLLYVVFRRGIVNPIVRLAGEVRRVASEDVHHHIRGGGPRELVQLAADTEAMRRRIVDELGRLQRARAELDSRSRDLERSNSDLEQFAYVASHDLQEPLRKVASFCQLLQRRYAGQLDDRADQYIGFAVDGAKRMQALINDLLAFSRVGRHAGAHAVVNVGALLDDALENLDSMIAGTGATVTRGPLPDVRGEPVLLTAVLQNLVGNGLKFHGEAPPDVRVEAERDGDEWVFSVADNGIGIEPEYAERIFVIFQRLHGKSAYPGTGIGLAMCRKIIEYHGGRIWLDTENSGGGHSRFRFTLPAPAEPPQKSTVDDGGRADRVDSIDPTEEAEVP